jgi:eukaryotic-like serine/threonine-protein kinase
MKPEEPIFADVLDLPASERAAFLDRACANDAELRARVETLLRAYDGAGANIESSPVALAADVVRAAGDGGSLDYSAGMRIGRYKLLQKLGEGGCGVVFMAEQEAPVRRRVALKVIKLGMDTREVIARFEAERQALALMDHPNIAHVLDADATELGRPFFVMELVRGTPITRYCDEHGVGSAERLHLFTQVCHAIQHAHQKGIIHRDLKPSNILVTLHDGVPVPKIIDFGIAKAMHGRLTDRTLFTAFEQFIGTPAYMSPEQMEMSGLDVDTRSDIYSLGVLLYELLTGRTPFESQALMKAGLDEMRRTIREEEPAKPSTRVSTLNVEDGIAIARQRGTDPEKLRSWLRGDVDWIVMRCLELSCAASRRTAPAAMKRQTASRWIYSVTCAMNRFWRGRPAPPTSCASSCGDTS